MKEWWENISERERLMVGSAVIFLLVAGIYFFLFAPLAERFATLRETVPEKRQELAWMQGAAMEVRALQRGGSAKAEKSGGSVMTIIDKSAKKLGLGKQLKRIEPDGQDGAKVWLEDVPHDDVMRWLHSLKNKYGVAPVSLSLEAGEAPGRIKARLTLTRREE